MNRAAATRLIVAVAVLATFLRSIGNEFAAWDVSQNISHNESFNPPTVSKILSYWHEPALRLYIPVTYTVWGALAYLAYLDEPDDRGIHLNPYVYHAASVAAHLISALLVLELLRRLLNSDWAALAGALVFAVHPVQVEAVAWASGLKDVLWGLFSLLALWTYIGYAQAPEASRSRRWHYAAATAALVLAMLSKPTAMITPLAAAAIDWLLLKRSGRQIAWALVPWAALSAGCALVTKLVQPAVGVPVTAAWTRPLIAGDALAFYLYKLVWPAELAPDYGRRPVVVIHQWWIWVTWLAPVAVAAAVWVLRRNWLTCAALIFVIGVLPVLGFVPFEFQGYSTVSDHYLYLSMLGVALAVAGALRELHGRTAMLAAGACAVVITALAVRSVAQSMHWQSEHAIWSHTLAINPQSWASHRQLGIELSSRGDEEGAARHFRAAVQIYPDHIELREDMAKSYLRRGLYAEALEEMRQIVRIAEQMPEQRRPSTAGTHNMMGLALMQLERYDEAVAEFELALRARPDFEEAAGNLAEARSKARPQTLPVQR